MSFSFFPFFSSAGADGCFSAGGGVAWAWASAVLAAPDINSSTEVDICAVDTAGVVVSGGEY